MTKLGKDTGSIVNYMYANQKPIIPEIGMGATLLAWSDRYAMTIHKVENKKLWASFDRAKRIDKNGISESQEYAYSNDNQDKPEFWKLFTLRKDDKWHEGTTLSGLILRIGIRQEYEDPTF